MKERPVIFSTFLLATVILSAQESQAKAKPPQKIHCEVAIVGGGAAGVHSLYKLSSVLHENVCLFEKNDYFGGRIKDIPSPNGNGVFGVGGLRVQETQNLMFNLAKELGFDLTQQSGNYLIGYGPQRIIAKGRITENSNSFLDGASPLYQTPTPTADFPDPASGYISGQYPDASTAWNCEGDLNYNGCYNDAYFHALLNPGYKPLPKKYKDNRDWLKDVLGLEGFQFLTDTFRFRGDFQNGIDPISYIDFLKEDWDACCSPTYPEGGMSSFINAMVHKAVLVNRARAFKNEPVQAINKAAHHTYKLTTPKFTVIANSVIIAVPPLALKKIDGNIANSIKAQREFKTIKPIRVISINNWWSDAWWEHTSSVDDPLVRIDRAWATRDPFNNTQLCFNSMEFGHAAYQKAQLATRSVYNDDAFCNAFWSNLYAEKGINGVNEEIVREFKIVFPEAASHLAVENITQTTYQDWQDAWHWLKGPTKLTNGDIAIWALEPKKGEKVSLVGEAYNLNRSGWVDGAIKSSINTLNYNFTDKVGHNARISGYFEDPLPCYSVDLVDGKLTYIPFNKDGDFNANCPEK
jgi:hypothetical protein